MTYDAGRQETKPGQSGARTVERLALRPKEAAEALGLSERKLRAMRSELPHARLGEVVVFPVQPLRSWLADRVKEQLGVLCEQIAGEDGKSAWRWSLPTEVSR